jgi:hypothetical protein
MAKDVKKMEDSLPAEYDPELDKLVQENLGKGVSTAAEDNLVPLIYVLQPLSPQVMDGPAYIEGARAGDIWLRNAVDPIVKAKEGIWFMPCHWFRKWTEWVPRDEGGGLIASYDYQGEQHLPEGAVRDHTVKQRPRYYFPDSGHECVDTRYEAGFIWRDGIPYPYVIPFKSTGLSVQRGWNTKRMNLRRKDGAIWPAWSHLYKLTTELKTNAQGSWYIFSVGEPHLYLPGYGKPVGDALKIVGGDATAAFKLGVNLQKDFATGQKQAMSEDMDTDAHIGDPDEENISQRARSEVMKDEIPF